MKKEAITNYAAPEVEVLELQVEKAFATSDLKENPGGDVPGMGDWQ